MKEVMKNPIVLSVWLNAFVDLFAGFFLFIYGPTYLKNVWWYDLLVLIIKFSR